MFEIKIMKKGDMSWDTPVFPRCSNTIEQARSDMHTLNILYDHVGIFSGSELVEEVEK